MKYLLFLVLIPVLLSCDDQRIFEKNNKINDDFWYVDSLMIFEFEITDGDLEYDLYGNFSHTSSYKYHNLYYRYFLQDSAKVEIASDLRNINFFDPKTGVPLGSGLGDIFDHRQLILKSYKFPYAGNYHIAFQQYMRMDSLPDVRSVGARVEIAKAE